MGVIKYASSGWLVGEYIDVPSGQLSHSVSTGPFEVQITHSPCSPGSYLFRTRYGLGLYQDSIT
jgi:hypothetical protein